ncbi:hypothetical protein B0H11DRAFT_2184387 [Mycena galericulata]|nr:hypothetical protein B0H11DRAFT_2184387 [Mycena galericulata]
MSPLNDPSASSLVTAALPTSTAAKIILVMFTIACMAYIIRIISPAHRTCILVSSLAAAEHTLLHTVEAGTFRSEYVVPAERLTGLQLDVSILREAALRDSLSYWDSFSQFFKFRRALAILRYIQEVRALKTHIEILNELQLRELLHEAETAAARTISMRRRL